jgi:hypothetical protein
VLEPAPVLSSLTGALQTSGSLAFELDAATFMDIDGCAAVTDENNKPSGRKAGYDEDVRAGKPLIFDLDQTRWSDLCVSSE